MPFGSGTFSLTYSFTTEAASPPIEIAKLDTQFQDIADGLSNCLLRDGTGLPTTAIPFNGQRLTGLGNASADADALNRQTGDGRYVLQSTHATTALAALLTVDGASSGLDADLLDGQEGSFYRSASNLNAGTLPDARFPSTLPAVSGANLTNLAAGNISSGNLAYARFSVNLLANDGSGSGLDADLLDGQQGSYYTNASNLASGTVPNARLPNIGSMPGVTIASDPGGTPSGSAGQIFFYY